MSPGAWAEGQAILRAAEELEKHDENSPAINNPEMNATVTANSLRATGYILKRNAPIE